MSRKRFGKRKQDKKRNWNKYDKKLVGRGEMPIPTTESKAWQSELKTMNNGKDGEH